MFSIFKKKKHETEIKEAIDHMKCELNIKNLHLRKELYQLTKYFNKIPFLHSIVDYESRIIRCNESMDKLLCNTNLLGSKLTDCVHPNDVDDFIQFLKDVRNNLDRKEITRLISEDGRMSYIRWGVSHLEDDQMILLFGQDITCEVDLGDELKKFIEYKNLVLDNYPGSVVCTDLSGVITEFNRSAEISSGYNRKHLLHKKHLLDIFPQKDLFDDNNMGGINKTYLRRFDGTELKSYLLLLPLNDGDKMVGYLGVWHDQSYVNYIKQVIE